MLDYGGTMVSSPRHTMLLGRIGRELALIYHDTLQAPLPASIQKIIDQLDEESGQQRQDTSGR